MGVKISYTITEEALAEFPAGKYVTTVEEGDNSTEDHKQYELTNCLTGQIDVKGSKIWKDNNNEYGTRPDSITINLYRENKYNRKTLVDSKTISADDSGNWYYEFVKLDKYDTKGVEYNYTVEENVLPETEEGHYVDTYKQTSKTHTELVIDIRRRCIVGIEHTQNFRSIFYSNFIKGFSFNRDYLFAYSIIVFCFYIGFFSRN